MQQMAAVQHVQHGIRSSSAPVRLWASGVSTAASSTSTLASDGLMACRAPHRCHHRCLGTLMRLLHAPSSSLILEGLNLCHLAQSEGIRRTAGLLYFPAESPNVA